MKDKYSSDERNDLYQCYTNATFGIKEINNCIRDTKALNVDTGFEKYLKKQIRRYGYLG